MGDTRLSESEMYIMQHFWESGPMKTEELSELVAEKKWKATTLLTFLSRLAAKGMLSVQKQGKANLYSPIVSQNEYLRKEGQIFLDEMYRGSARLFLASMAEGKGLSAAEVSELKEWLDKQEVYDE